ncbi:MAG: YHS domain-containing protein, partial [Pyrinomonadaceae bacterium]|nr:YHS domain-containing protein [Pyrinomonadaceae bacterium]
MSKQIDPICGMAVDTDDAAASAVRDGETFYFCSNACSEKFAAQSQSKASSGSEKLNDHADNGSHSVADIHTVAKPKTSYKDPVCGIMLDLETATAKIESDGKTFYFCSDKCKSTFESGAKAEQVEGISRQAPHSESDPSGHHDQSKSDSVTETTHKDPVCGMVVDPGSAAANRDIDGTTYYFCSDACIQKFDKDPDQYLKAGKDTEPAVEMEGVEYTCPMHPEIVQDKPGS